MATHLSAWQQSVDQATLAAINSVQDSALTPSGATRFFVPPVYDHIHWAIATGPSITDARIVTPSLDQSRGQYIITPRRRAAGETLSLVAPEVFRPMRPIPLLVGETIEIQTAEDGVGATQMDAIIALGPAELPAMPTGNPALFRATGTTTLVARAWTAVTLTPVNSFPVGTYALIGLLAFSANALAARVLFQGAGYRPGVPALAGTELGAGSDYIESFWRLFGGYLMGSFTHATVPQVEFFSPVADTSEVVYFIVIKTA